MDKRFELKQAELIFMSIRTSKGVAELRQVECELMNPTTTHRPAVHISKFPLNSRPLYQTLDPANAWGSSMRCATPASIVSVCSSCTLQPTNVKF